MQSAPDEIGTSVSAGGRTPQHELRASNKTGGRHSEQSEESRCDGGILRRSTPQNDMMEVLLEALNILSCLRHVGTATS